MELRVIFFCMWSALWYNKFCGLIFLLVECALVLWNFLLYFYACGTRSAIVEFCVMFLCVWDALWYCGILCYIFLRASGTRSGIVKFCVIFFCVPVEQPLVLCNFVLYFLHVSGTRSVFV